MKLESLLFCVAATLMICACSDDNGTSVDKEEIAGPNHVTIDKAQKAIIFQWSDYSEELCIWDKGTFHWDMSESKSGADTSYYETHGDTLIVYFNNKREYDPHYYLGGSTDKIFGEWTNIECMAYDGNVYCTDEDERKFKETYYSTVLTISENEFQEKFVYKPAFFKYDDYMNSYYLMGVYTFLRYPNINPPTSLSALRNPWQESLVKTFEKDNGITTLEKTKTSRSFEISGKKFELKVTEVERDSIYYKLAVEIGSEGTTCSYSEDATKLTKDSCKDLTVENIPYYNEKDLEETISMGAVGTAVSTHHDPEKFTECLKSISLDLPGLPYSTN